MAHRIILVEDNPADVELTRVALNSLEEEIELIHFSDGEVFIKQLPGLVLEDLHSLILDINMPKLDGLRLLKDLRRLRQFNHLPIVVFSSSGLQEDKRTAKMAGATIYVEKPHDFDTFFDMVCRIFYSFLKPKKNYALTDRSADPLCLHYKEDISLQPAVSGPLHGRAPE